MFLTTGLRLVFIIGLSLIALDLLARATVGAKPVPAELIARPHHHMIAAANRGGRIYATKGDRLDRATFDERFDAAAATAISDLT